LEKQTAALQRELESTRTEAASRYERLAGELAKEQTQVAAARRAAEEQRDSGRREVDRERDALRAEVDKLRQQHRVREEERAGLLQRLKALEQARAHVQAGVNDTENRLRQQIAVLSQEASEARRQGDAACLRHADLEQQVATLRAELDQKRQQQTDHQ